MPQNFEDFRFRDFWDVDDPHHSILKLVVSKLRSEDVSDLNTAFQLAWSREILESVEEATEELDALESIALSGRKFNFESSLKNRAMLLRSHLATIACRLKDMSIADTEGCLKNHETESRATEKDTETDHENGDRSSKRE